MALTNKEKHKYSKLLAKKLQESGINDNTVLRQTGKFKWQLKAGHIVTKPRSELTKADLEAHFEPRPSTVASNLQRNMIKRLLKSGKDTIESFLASDLSALVKQAGKEVEEKDSEIKIG